MAIPPEWIYRPDPQLPVPSPAEVGGKAHHLARLGAAGAAVPAWISLTPAAFAAFAGAADLPEPFRAAVIAALREAGLWEKSLAVRSSAVVEDAAGASFAGQFDSVLGVPAAGDGAALWQAIRRVWTSAAGERAAAYGSV